MSINWVMLSEGGVPFVKLPGERVISASPARTALGIKTASSYPGVEPFSITSSSGQAYLTNQRVVYLPSAPTPQFQSFSAPVLNLHDTHVSAPFFGPNAWVAALQPVAGGGIPSKHLLVEVKLTFKEGGAYDFQTQFEQIKERLQQAMELARENGNGNVGGNSRGGGPLSHVNMSNVDLEDLPAYEPQEQGQKLSNSMQNAPTASSPSNPPSASSADPPASTAPDEPPPGYEESQSASVTNELERITDDMGHRTDLSR